VAAAVKGTFFKTLAAAGVLAALGTYIYFVESQRSDTEEKKKEKVFAFIKAKARELSLEPRTGTSLRLVKQGAQWKLAAPLEAAADQGEIDSLLQTLEGLELSEVVSEKPASLADFGLETPKVKVAITSEGAKEPLVLLIGDKAPDGSGLYAKLPQRPRVFTIASWLDSTFDKKPFDFRDRDLLHVKRDDVRTLEVTGPEGGYTLVRGEGGEWAFTKPLATRAGRWSVDSLLGTLEGLRMEQIAAEDAKDLKPFGLAPKPARSVLLSLADGSQRKLEIGAPTADKKYHARDALKTLVAVIPPALPDDLAKGMAELRQKRLLDISTYEVSGFDLELAGGKRVYERATFKNDQGVDSYRWKRSAPETKALDTAKVQDALFKVGALEAQEFVDAPKGPAAYGLDAPVLRLTLRYASGKPGAWLEVGKKYGAAYARRPDDAAVLKLDVAKGDELVKALSEL
jgi:hypothetical protein